MYFFGRFGLVSSLIGFLLCLTLTIEWFLGYSIGNRPLLLLGVLLILLGMQFFATGYLASLIVETNAKRNYAEDHIKAIYKQTDARDGKE